MIIWHSHKAKEKSAFFYTQAIAWKECPINMVPPRSEKGEGAIAMISRRPVVFRLACRWLTLLDRCVRGPNPTDDSCLLAVRPAFRLFFLLSLMVPFFLFCLILLMIVCERRYKPPGALKNFNPAQAKEVERPPPSPQELDELTNRNTLGVDTCFD